MIPSLCIPPFSLLAFMSCCSWLVLAVKLMLRPLQDTQTRTPNSVYTLRPFQRSWPVSSASLSILLHVSSSSNVYCLSSLSPFPVWCAVKTAVKHSLISPAISQGNPNEKILPTFSFSCHTAHHKCWQETAVTSLTFYSALRTHTHTHTIPITGSVFESADSGMVWRDLMTHNVASILVLHGQATRCTICPLFKGERGA